MTLMDRSDNGAVSAEFAVAMPAVVFLIVICGDLVGLGLAHFNAETCVHRAAREISRQSSLSSSAPPYQGCVVSAHRDGEWIVVRAEVARPKSVLGRVWPVVGAETAVWHEQPGGSGADSPARTWNARLQSGK